MRKKKKSVITLTTDFGLKDHYVGAMKGVILSINPDALIIDITHDIQPHDIFGGAFALRNVHRYFPEGTIHVVIVDPGVGSTRKAIALEADGNLFLGPDNGVFTFVYREVTSPRVFEVSNARYMLSNISSTFHGRDVFASAAAHLSLGVPVENLGQEIRKRVELSLPGPEIRGGKIRGAIIHIDSFGNLITNIRAGSINPRSSIQVGERMIRGVSKSYSDAPEGALLVVAGSSGFLEISVNRGRASDFIDSEEKVIVSRY